MSACAAKVVRSSLLEELHCAGRVTQLGLRDEEVHMLGHHYVSEHRKAHLLPDFFEHAQKTVTPRRLGKQRTPAVATEGDEVQAALAVVAAQSPGHSV